MNTALPWIDNPYRLISWLDMLRFSADQYMSLATSLARLSLDAERHRGDPYMRVAYIAGFAENLKHVASDLTQIGCPVSSSSAMRLAEEMSESWSSETLDSRMTALSGNISDEMGQHLFFWVPSERAKFYDSTEKTFGEDVANRFASSLSEIRDAGNCYAFGQSTACVFHLMRVMEIGLKALYASLGLPFDRQISWELILRDWSREEIKGNATANALLMAHLDFYQSMRATVSSVKDAWRNPTMHFDRTYSLEEAEEILGAVKAFMRCVSAEIDESGKRRN
jgi:hypothetical protein